MTGQKQIGFRMAKSMQIYKKESPAFCLRQNARTAGRPHAVVQANVTDVPRMTIDATQGGFSLGMLCK